MNRSFQVSPPVDPDMAASAAFEYSSLRIKFLNLMMRGASVLALFALISGILQDISTFQKAVYVVLYVTLALATFIPLPYWLKAGVFAAIFFVAAIVVLLERGIYTDATIFFLTFSLLALLLFDFKAGIIATAMNLISILVVGWVYVTGQHSITWGGTELGPGSMLDWIAQAFNMLLVNMAIGTGIWLLQDKLEKIVGQFQIAYSEISGQRSELEKRLEERTAGLSRKTEQLRAASYIARQTAEVQDLASLLNTVARLVTDQFGFYHTGIFLINETGEQAVLQAASSEGGHRMIERGHALSVGLQGIVGYVAAQKKPRIALDVGTDAVFFNNPDLPMTRSEVALPLLIRNKVLGVLDIQSDRPEAFNTDDIDVLQTLTDQVAVAIENARLLDEAQAALMQLEAVTSVRTREAWGQKLEQKGRAFTYTPLGLRAEKSSQNGDKALNAPITLRGQKIGTISIARKGEASWGTLDQDLIDEVAAQVGLAVDNIRLLEDATQRAKQEQTVGKLATRFGQSLDIDTLLQTAARELGQLPGVEEATVFIGEMSNQEKARANMNRKSRDKRRNDS